MIDDIMIDDTLFEHPFVIRKSEKKSLSDCLSSYSKEQLQLLVEAMGLSDTIKASAKKI